MDLLPPSFPSLSFSLSLSVSVCRLYVAGRSLAPGLWCEQSVQSPSSPLSAHSLYLTEEEEVYEAEGSIEEFLAYDGKEMYVISCLLLNLPTILFATVMYLIYPFHISEFL